MNVTEQATLHTRPQELLQRLIRFETVNPPGNEGACVAYIDEVLRSYGIETQIHAKIPNRPNLVARLKGAGNAPPLMLYGHVDVVTVANQKWTHHPFGGDIIDGYIWGRGALDMKGGITMLIAAFLRAKAEGVRLPGDVVLCIVSDEEEGGVFGAKFLVEEHPELFSGIRYAIGEFGGFSLHMFGRHFYPIMVAEKQMCQIEATIRGSSGHGSMPLRGQAMARLGAMLQALDRHSLPVHLTPVARLMLKGMATTLPSPINFAITKALDLNSADRLLTALGRKLGPLDAMLRNTATATIVSGGEKFNVVPAEIKVRLDGRLLPGFTPDDILAEIRAVIGNEIELKVLKYDQYPAQPDLGLFHTLQDILQKADPTGSPIPLLLVGSTDGRHFARLGIQTYGFLPMRLPKNFNFIRTIHAADERIPADTIDFGAQAIYQVVQRFGEAEGSGEAST